MNLSRRSLLKGIATAAAFGGVGIPALTARARVPVSPVSVLVLDFAGAWNIHASFAARTHPGVNPHGVYAGRDTGIIRASNGLFRDRDKLFTRDSAAWGTRIPGFEDEAHELSVIGAMRHAESYDLDDHIPSAVFTGTGYLGRLDAPGIGTVISRYAPRDQPAPPAVVIGKGYASAEMARAPGPWLPYAPVTLANAVLPASGEPNVRWVESERRLDEGARAARRSLAAQKAEALLRYKDAFRRHRGFFLDPAVHTADPTAAGQRFDKGILGSASPTTQQILEAFGGRSDGDESALALGFRCLEGGSRFVSVSLGFWARVNAHDMHDHEDEAFALYVRDAQLLAGLSFLLKRVGLAKRVLVVCLSEMARSPYAGTGYNAAGGTDHGKVGIISPRGLRGSTRQSVLLGHGPIVAGREAYAADPEYGDPVGKSCITAELLALLAECSGVERDDHPWHASPDGAPLDADALARVLVA
ncbi:hypothetical protein BH11MYX4_BH11MYX4_68360 [soil metagenome]